MEITGTWDPQMDEVLVHLCKITGGLEDGIRALASAEVKKASSLLYSNVSAVSSTLYKICKDTRTRCSSQAVGSLLRTIIEASISVFAFCKDPPGRASLFLHYDCVLTFRHPVNSMRNIGCPFLPASRYDPARVGLAKALARKVVLRCGADYLEKKPKGGKTVTDLLVEATTDGSEHPAWFRDHWFPEQSRAEVLAYEQMAWLDDVLYKWLCSCVHSDIWAASPLSGMKRSDVAMFGIQFWGASVLRLFEALEIRLGPEHANLLRDQFYRPLQWTPNKA